MMPIFGETREYKIKKLNLVVKENVYRSKFTVVTLACPQEFTNLSICRALPEDVT